MDDVLKKVGEVRNLLIGYVLYDAVLDFMLAFLVSAIVLSLIGLGMLYSVIPALIYSLAKIYKNLRESDVLSQVEENYRSLKERLKTAYDNRGRDNIILTMLRKDVSLHMSRINADSFMEAGIMVKKVFGVIFLSFVLLSVSVVQFKGAPVLELLGQNPVLNDAKDKIDSYMGINDLGVDDEGRVWQGSNYSNPQEEETLGAEAGGKKPGIAYGPLPGRGGGAGDDVNDEIFGEASSASLEGQDIDLRLHPEYGGDIEVNEEESRRAPIEDFVLPDVESLEECRECITAKEHEEIVRRYFEKIAEG
ncbi:hypothetical protein ACFLRC_03525 [Candidatus Altiarchaeota archaeon]